MKKKNDPGLGVPMIEDLAEVVEILTEFMNCDGKMLRDIPFPASLCRLARHFDTDPWDLLAGRLEMRGARLRLKKTKKKT